jgi:hypothetical protein
MHAAQAVHFHQLLNARPLSIEDAKARVRVLRFKRVEISVPQLRGDPVMVAGRIVQMYRYGFLFTPDGFGGLNGSIRSRLKNEFVTYVDLVVGHRVVRPL